MTLRSTSTRRTAFVALFTFFALLASACGTESDAITADRVLPQAAPAAPAAGTTSDTGQASETSEVPAAPAAGQASGHEYGTSIEDWGDGSQDDASESDSGAISLSPFDEVTWDDLIPVGESGQEIIASFEARLDEVETGSPEANAIYEEIRGAFDPAAVNNDLDGRPVRLAGFVAPLTYEDELIIEFLLVPNFGACIHVPPPPPNQTVMVTIDEGLTAEEAWGPVWVEGTMTIDYATTDLAEASYRIERGASGVYSDF